MVKVLYLVGFIAFIVVTAVEENNNGPQVIWYQTIRRFIKAVLPTDFV